MTADKLRRASQRRAKIESQRILIQAAFDIADGKTCAQLAEEAGIRIVNATKRAKKGMWLLGFKDPQPTVHNFRDWWWNEVEKEAFERDYNARIVAGLQGFSTAIRFAEYA